MKKRLQGLNSKQQSGKMAQPIVETEIVAVEADGAETKPNVPMCEAQGQVICNTSILASPVVRPANPKSPDMPDIPNAQAKAVDVTGKLEITRVELNTTPANSGIILVMSSGSRESVRNYNWSIVDPMA